MTTEAPAPPAVAPRYAAEFVGTFILVLGVIGAATFSAAFDAGDGGLNSDFLGVALALGLSVLGGAYAWGLSGTGNEGPRGSSGPIRQRAVGRQRSAGSTGPVAFAFTLDAHASEHCR